MIDSQPGLGPQMLEGPGTNSAAILGYLSEVFQTGILDLTQLQSDIELVPGRPGFIPRLHTCGVLMETKTGTQTLAINFRAGSDPGRQNFITTNANPNNANVNAVLVPSIFAVIQQTNSLKRYPGLPVYLNITQAALGTPDFTLRASFLVHVIWCPVELNVAYP